MGKKKRKSNTTQDTKDTPNCDSGSSPVRSVPARELMNSVTEKTLDFLGTRSAKLTEADATNHMADKSSSIMNKFETIQENIDKKEIPITTDNNISDSSRGIAVIPQQNNQSSAEAQSVNNVPSVDYTNDERTTRSSENIHISKPTKLPQTPNSKKSLTSGSQNKASPKTSDSITEIVNENSEKQSEQKKKKSTHRGRKAKPKVLDETQANNKRNVRNENEMSEKDKHQFKVQENGNNKNALGSERNDETITRTNEDQKRAENDDYVNVMRKLNKLIRDQTLPKVETPLEDDEDPEEMEYQLLQRVIFQPYVCHVCKRLESEKTSLKKCTSCKMISYCSKDHQKEHWSSHKQLCKMICKICKSQGLHHLFQKAVGLSPHEYRCFRINLIDECVKGMGRGLELWEREMFYYAQVCHTCYDCDKSKLNTCTSCQHVSFCKPSHLQANHNRWCKDFQLYRDITLHQAHNGMILPLLPQRICTEYQPLPENMNKLVVDSSIASGHKLPSRLHYAVLTDLATCPLTTLFALQKCYPLLNSMKTLTVHLVGAELHFEAHTLNKWEMFLLHMLPNVVSLKVVFVGPELDVDSVSARMLGDRECCPRCKAAGRQVMYEFSSKTLYHEYTVSGKMSRPDVICAFNAGLYRTTGFNGRDSWPLSIGAMLQDPAVPVVVTAYTAHELPLDVDRMGSCAGLQIILPPVENPFSSSKPSLNFVTEEVVPVIFKNFYVAIVKKSVP